MLSQFPWYDEMFILRELVELSRDGRATRLTGRNELTVHVFSWADFKDENDVLAFKDIVQNPIRPYADTPATQLALQLLATYRMGIMRQAFQGFGDRFTQVRWNAREFLVNALRKVDGPHLATASRTECAGLARSILPAGFRYVLHQRVVGLIEPVFEIAHQLFVHLHRQQRGNGPSIFRHEARSLLLAQVA